MEMMLTVEMMRMVKLSGSFYHCKMDAKAQTLDRKRIINIANDYLDKMEANRYHGMLIRMWMMARLWD